MKRVSDAVDCEKLFLLDAGGVIINDAVVAPIIKGPIADRSTRSVDELYAYYKTPEIYRPLWDGDITPNDFWQQILDYAGVSDLKYSELNDLARARAEIIPNAKEAVAQLAARGEVWLLSNHVTEWLMPPLEQAGIAQYIAKAFISSDIHAGKPSPESFGAVLAAWHGDPADILFVDDKDRNTNAAAAFGMETLCVAKGGNPLSWLGDALRHTR